MSSPTTSSGSSDWLESRPPWASQASLPFIPLSSTNVPAVNDDKSTVSTSNLDLLSQLLRTCRTAGLEHQSLALEDLYGNEIGEGTTYRVARKRVNYSSTNQTWVAAKRAKLIVPKASGIGRTVNKLEYNRLRAVLLEIGVLTHPPLKSHPNIVDLIGYDWDEEVSGYAPIIIMELATFGNLTSLFSKETLSDAERTRICIDIVCGLEAVHSCMIIHGDVKQENVLIFPGSGKRFIAKMSDFEHTLLGGELPHYRGTPIYNAPEAQHYDLRGVEIRRSIPAMKLPLCDVFSFGLLAFEVLNGGTRYYKLQESSDFQSSLVTQESGEEDCLLLALRFLGSSAESLSDLQGICEAIFLRTLHRRPENRLEGGWSAIKLILGEKPDMFTQTKQSPAIPWKRSIESRYSVLQLFYQVDTLSQDVLGTQMWNEITYLAQDALTSVQRGQYLFEQFLMYTLGNPSSDLGLGGALQWLSSAMTLGYPPAVMVGKRIHDALEIPLSSSQSNDMVGNNVQVDDLDLEDLPASCFYSSAVQILFGRESQKKMRQASGKYGFTESTAAFHVAFKQKMEELERGTFLHLAEEKLLLHRAVSLGDYDSTLLMLQLGLSFDRITPEGLTPLHIACRCGNVRLIQLLTTYGADASLNDFDNVSPLHWLIILPDKEIPVVARALVKNRADLNCTMKKQCGIYYDGLALPLVASPLWWACICCNYTAVDTLLSLGADHTIGLEGRGKDYACLFITLGTLRSDILQLFFDKTDILRQFGSDQTAKLFNYVGMGIPNDFQRWCIHGKNYRMAYTQLLDTLIHHGIAFPSHPAMIVDKTIYTPLVRAAVSHNAFLVEEYLRRGADVNERDSMGATALNAAILSCTAQATSPIKAFNTIELLLRMGATTEALADRTIVGSRCALHNACSAAVPTAIIKLLADKIPDLVHCECDGRPPLNTLAASIIDENSVKSVHVLLQHGADINVESEHRSTKTGCCLTAVAGALCNDGWPVAELLLDLNAVTNVGARGNHQQTLTHLLVDKAFRMQGLGISAEDKRTAELLESLLDHPLAKRRDLLNQPDSYGMSPIVHAAAHGLPFYVKIFLERGAKTNDIRVTDGADGNVVFEAKSLSEFIEYVWEKTPGFVGEDEEIEAMRHYGKARVRKRSEYRAYLKEIMALLKP